MPRCNALSVRILMRLLFFLLSCFFVQIVLALEFEVTPEIKSSDLFVLGKLFGSAMFEYLAVDQQIGAITDREGFVYVMVGDEDADIPEFKPRDNGLDVFH